MENILNKNGKYVEVLKEKSDEVFKQSLAELNDYITKSKTDNKGNVEASADHYTTGFSYWLLDLMNEDKPILTKSIMNIAIIAETSLFLSLHGHYISAVSELRRLLDSFLTRIYFQILINNDEIKEYWIDENSNFISWASKDDDKKPSEKAKMTTNAYSQWEFYSEKYIKSIELYPEVHKYMEFPSKDNILTVIFRETPLLKYNHSFKLRERINKLYNELSKFNHDRPGILTNQNQSSNLFNSRFVKNDFLLWLNYLKQTYRIISCIIMLYCPNLTDKDEASRFKTYFKEDYDNVKRILGSISHPSQ